jgi:hypothetical protein
MSTELARGVESQRVDASELKLLRLAGGLNQPEVVARVRSDGQLRLTQGYLSQLGNSLRITKPGTIAIIRGTIELILSERLQEVQRLLAASR